jgi:hypothetical protein
MSVRTGGNRANRNTVSGFGDGPTGEGGGHTSSQSNSSRVDEVALSKALTQHFESAVSSGVKTGLSSYFASVKSTLPTAALQHQAEWLEMKSYEREGQIQRALTGYEQIMTRPVNKADSVSAIMAAMRLHLMQLAMHKPDLTSQFPQHRVTTPPELAARSQWLIRSLYEGDKIAGTKTRSVPIPKQYKLYQNYPNPFNPTTEIRFDIPEKTRIELRIYNILGQQVTTLVDEIRNAGAYQILWDSKSASGIPVASGMYIYQLKCDKFVDAKKMVMIR